MSSGGNEVAEDEGASFGWETSKENLQPVKVGRSAGALKQASDLVSSDQETVRKATEGFEKQRKAFEDELASYSGDDKLGLWVQYLKWYQTALPATSKQSETVPLLERCTSELFNLPQYKSDVRMLRIWIQYADLVKEPEDIFRFLQVHGIGQEFALFYEAYALCLEKRGSHKDAMAVYDLGVSNMAMPIDRLRRKLTAFHKRMAKRAERDARRSLQATPMHQEGIRQPRQALSSIQRPAIPHSQQGPQTALQTPQVTSDRGRNDDFSIYADTPSELNNAQGRFPRAALSTLSHGASELPPPQPQADWARLQRQEEVSKENEQKAEYSISQPNARFVMAQQSTPNVNSLDILVDEEFVEPPSFALPNSSANVRRAADGNLVASARMNASTSRSSTRKPKVKPSQTLMAYDENSVKDKDTGEDVSFEERRATLAVRRNSTRKEATSTSEDIMLTNAVEQVSDLHLSDGLPSEKNQPAPSSQDGDLGVTSPRPTADDVTLCTKEAFETIDAMFTSQNTAKQIRKSRSADLLDDGDVQAPLSHQRVTQRLDFGEHAVASDNGAFSLDIYEDTTIIPPSASAAVPSTSLGQDSLFDHKNSGLYEEIEDKENDGGTGHCGGAASTSFRGSENGNLKELDHEELCARGISIGDGLPSDDDDIFARGKIVLCPQHP